MFFKRKSLVEEVEQQFKMEVMRDRHIFYDLFARVGDPEELRAFINELLTDMGWKTTLNELTKFEEMEVEGIFTGGRLKPFKNVIKSHSHVEKGSKFPLLWKLFLFVGFILLGFYVYSLFDTTHSWNSNIFLWGAPVAFILAISLYLIKEIVRVAIWIKIAGVYDVSSEEADLRIIIAADAEKVDNEAYKKLEEEVSELYNVITRKYVKRIKREVHQNEVIKEFEKTEEEPQVKLFKQIKDIDSQIAALEKSFINGKMNEETYKQIKSDLEKRRSKLDTIMDLINVT